MSRSREPASTNWDGHHRLLLVGVVCLVTVVALESMAISTVMPVVEDDLGDLWLYGWVFSAFYLGTLVGVVVGGRAVDRVRPIGPMMIGVAIFGAGLLVGGLAPSMAVLVLGRFLQGLGAGAVPAVSYVCVGRGFPAELRPKVFAIMSTAWVLPALVSPLLASVVADAFGWRWVFLGLIPVTALVAVVGGPAVATVETPPSAHDADATTPISTVLLLALGAVLLLSGLGMERLWLGLPLAGVGMLLGLPAFRRLTPEGTLRARPRLPAAVLVRGVLTFSFFSADAFVSLSITSVRGRSTAFAGVVLIVSSITWTVGSWIQARFGERLGANRLVRVGGLLLVTGALGMAVSLDTSVPIVVWPIASCVLGLGMGMSYTVLSVVTLGEAEAGREGAATSALQMSDILGVSLGTGFGGVLVSLGDRLDGEAWIPLAAVYVLSAAMGAVVATLAPRLTRGLDPDAPRVLSDNA
ncbi:MAG: MFS transporter [Microthrixaceae bacterium]